VQINKKKNGFIYQFLLTLMICVLMYSHLDRRNGQFYFIQDGRLNIEIADLFSNNLALIIIVAIVKIVMCVYEI